MSSPEHTPTIVPLSKRYADVPPLIDMIMERYNSSRNIIGTFQFERDRGAFHPPLAAIEERTWVLARLAVLDAANLVRFATQTTRKAGRVTETVDIISASLDELARPAMLQDKTARDFFRYIKQPEFSDFDLEFDGDEGLLAWNRDAGEYLDNHSEHPDKRIGCPAHRPLPRYDMTRAQKLILDIAKKDQAQQLHEY